jgi:hypothetical protein
MVCAAAVLWFTQVQAAIEKANAAPSREEVDAHIMQAASQAIQHMNDSLQPIREDVRATRTDIEWIKNELNKRR